MGAQRTAKQVPGLRQAVSDGDSVSWGDVQGQVLLTEGHINGHISFLFDNILFCGDTLFTGGCGYLFDGPPQKMYESLLRLGQLPKDTMVC